MDIPQLKENGILEGLPEAEILARLENAPGKEIEKIKSAESSASLAINAFGFFYDKVGKLPRLPLDVAVNWNPKFIQLEFEARFPWADGRHPWLDAVVDLPDTFIGIESKRYEPFRAKSTSDISDAYYRDVWGDNMNGFCKIRDWLDEGKLQFQHLNAHQLFKHAFGLRSFVVRQNENKRPILVYLYAEPKAWPDGKIIADEDKKLHADEIKQFAKIVAGDEVLFFSLSYQQLLESWRKSHDAEVRSHATTIEKRFFPY